MKGWVIALIVIAVVAVALIIWIISIHNKFIRKRNKTEEAFSTMDVYLTKRYDLVPNIVETVKGYAKHEKSTLESVIAARNGAVNATTAGERIDADNQLTNALKSLNVVVERYPELKANSNFINLQNQLTAIEEDIAKSRKYYNAVTNEFNTYMEIFPNKIFAKSFKFKRRPLYEVDGAEQRQAVKVSFD